MKMKTLALFLAVVGQVSLVRSDEIGPDRKEHRIGKDTIVLERVRPNAVPQQSERAQVNRQEPGRESQPELPQEYYGIRAIPYANGLSKIECWPLGLGRNFSSTAVSNLEWNDLEGLSALDLGGVRYSFILFKTPPSSEEARSLPSGVQSLSDGEAQYRAQGGSPNTLRFLQRLHTHVTANRESMREAAAQRRELARANAEEAARKKEEPKTTVIRYWKRQSE